MSDGGGGRADAAAWAGYLAGAPGRRLARLTDFPPPAPRRATAVLRRIRVDAPAPDEARALTSGSAALAALLHRVTGAQEFVFAAADTGLTVLRIGVRRRHSAAELLAAVAAELAGSAVRGAPTREQLEAARPRAAGLELPPCHGLVTTARGYAAVGDPLEFADIALVLDVAGAVPRSALLVNAEVIDGARADRLAGMLGELLPVFFAAALDDAGGAAGGRADVAIGSLPLRPATATATAEATATGEFERFGPVHARILAHARRHPHAPCLDTDERTWSYADVAEASGRLANRLRALGVEPGGSVGVRLGRGPEHIVAQLAALRAGAAVLLLRPDEPVPGSAPGLSAVVTTAAAGAPDRPPPLVRIDDPADRWTGLRADFRDAPADPRSVAHIARTRGTREPRSVRLRHDAWSRGAAALIAEAGLGRDAVGCWFSPLDAGLVQLEALTTLAAGGRVRLPVRATDTAEERRDWLVSRRITHTLQFTLVAEALWAMDWPADTALRIMMVTGDRMMRWPGPRLPFSVLNLYGSTDAHLVALCDVSAVASMLDDRRRTMLSPPVGRPIVPGGALVVDDAGAEVPPDVLGTLRVRAPGADGRGRDTGDLARTWPDGQIEVLGRSAARLAAPRPPSGSADRVDSAGTTARLCALWTGFGGGRPADPDTDFLDLGGDSLAAVSLCHAVSRLWGVDYTIRELTRSPTPASTARWLERGARGAPSPAPGGAYPPAPASRRLWRQAGVGRGFELCRWQGVTGLDADRLALAWNALCAVHPALRTSVDADGMHVPGPARPLGRALSRAHAAGGQAELVLRRARDGEGRGEVVELWTHRALVDAESVHRLVLPALAALCRNPRAEPAAPVLDPAGYARAAEVQWAGHAVPDAAPAERWDGPARTRRATVPSKRAAALAATAAAAGTSLESAVVAAFADAAEQLGAAGGCRWWRPERLPAFTGVEDLVGSFTVPTTTGPFPEARSFAARARAAQSAGPGAGAPAWSPARVAVTVVGRAAEDAAGWRAPDLITSIPIYSDIDIRVIESAGRLLVHGTAAPASAAWLDELIAAFTARIALLCEDPREWWRTGSAEADRLGSAPDAAVLSPAPRRHCRNGSPR